MRRLVLLIALFFPGPLWAQNWEDRRLFNEGASGPHLRLLSSTDTEIFAPIVAAFIARNDDVAVEYLVLGTAEIDRRFRTAPEAFDLVISSAMDLQFKLANDGFGLVLPDLLHPSWAQWRQTLFAFTSEPATVVINRAAFAGQPVPRTRRELIEALRARPEVFEGRVGTYDVRQSGLGYLFATQDARASETFWRLMEVMGALDVKLYCCSADMIEDLAQGKIAVAYNVLGSYAKARPEAGEILEVILPADFPTTMMRTVLVSRATDRPRAARAFVQHLLRMGSDPGRGPPPLPPLNTSESDADRAIIALEPTLMTFLDALKRRTFLEEWEDAIIQN